MSDSGISDTDFTREEPEQTLPYRAAAFHFDRSGWYDPACCPHCDKALPERCLEGGLFGKYPRSVFARCPHCIPDISDRTVRNRRWQKNTDLTCMKYVPYCMTGIEILLLLVIIPGYLPWGLLALFTGPAAMISV